MKPKKKKRKGGKNYFFNFLKRKKTKVLSKSRLNEIGE